MDLPELLMSSLRAIPFENLVAGYLMQVYKKSRRILRILPISLRGGLMGFLNCINWEKLTARYPRKKWNIAGGGSEKPSPTNFSNGIAHRKNFAKNKWIYSDNSLFFQCVCLQIYPSFDRRSLLTHSSTSRYCIQS